MSGDSGDMLVVQEIAKLGDARVKRALSRMFNFELQNQDAARRPFRTEYEAIVRDGAKDWSDPERPEGR